MSLRVRTLLLVFGVLLISSTLLFLGARFFLLSESKSLANHVHDGFGKVEHVLADRNVDRATDALLGELYALDVKLRDWSNWDDSYNFLVMPNDAFLKSNVNQGALENLELHVMMFADVSGKIVKLNTRNPATGDTEPVPEGLEEWLSADSGLQCSSQEDTVSAMIGLPSGTFYFAARPSLTTDGDGPMHGTILFGFFMTPQRMEKLAQQTHLGLYAFPLHGAQSSRTNAILDSVNSDPDGIWFQADNTDSIAGYTVVRDLRGYPAFLLRVSMPREIMQQSRSTLADMEALIQQSLNRVLIFLAFSSLGLALLLVFLLERGVVRRVDSLAKSVLSIGRDMAFAKRVPIQGSDELGQLAGAVNAMLAALEQAHHSLASEGESRRLLLETVPVGLFSVNLDFCILPGASREAAIMLRKKTSVGLDGLSLQDVFQLRDHDWEKLRDFLDVYRLGLLTDAEMPGLNPFPELELLGTSNRARWARLTWVPIGAPTGTPRNMLCILQDISEERTLEDEARSMRAELAFLKVALDDPRHLSRFLADTAAVQKAVSRELPRMLTVQDLESEADQQLVHELFRMVHGVSGMAGSFGLTGIAAGARCLEASLAWLRDGAPPALASGPMARGSEPFTELSKALVVFSNELRAAETLSRRFLGDDPNVRQISVPEPLIEQIMLRASQVNQELAVLISELQTCRLVNFGRAFSRLPTEVNRIAGKLGKSCEFVMQGTHVRLDADRADSLRLPVLHLVRNALAHGIEISTEREGLGKPPMGVLLVACSHKGDWLHIVVEDDGRGIDREHILDLAFQRDIIDSTWIGRLIGDDELLGILSHPGFSSNPMEDGISGRGVGLDAVCRDIAALGGKIELRSEKGKGTTFEIVVPWKVDLSALEDKV